MVHTLSLKLRERPLLDNYGVLFDYLRASMASLTAEQGRMLFLTGRNHLIRDEVIALGSLDVLPTYRRELIHRALDLGAANLILVHNHPSGDPKPSSADVSFNKQLQYLAREMNLCLIDSIIVGRDECFSMRIEGGF